MIYWHSGFPNWGHGRTRNKRCNPRIKPLLPLFKSGKLKNLAVRVYNPQVSKETVEVIKALRKQFGDSLEIFAGQAIAWKRRGTY